MEDRIIKDFPKRIASYEERITGYAADNKRATENTRFNADRFSPMTLNSKTYTEKKEAGEAILAACKAMTDTKSMRLGEYRGFTMELYFDIFSREYKVTIYEELRHTVALGSDIFGNIQRLGNTLDAFATRLTTCMEQLENVRYQLQSAK